MVIPSELRALQFKDYVTYLKIYEETGKIVKEQLELYNNGKDISEEDKTKILTRLEGAEDLKAETAETLFSHLLLQELLRLAPDNVKEDFEKQDGTGTGSPEPTS